MSDNFYAILKNYNGQRVLVTGGLSGTKRSMGSRKWLMERVEVDLDGKFRKKFKRLQK